VDKKAQPAAQQGYWSWLTGNAKTEPAEDSDDDEDFFDCNEDFP